MKLTDIKLTALPECGENISTAKMASKIGKKLEWRLFLALLVINDLVMALFAFRAAYWIRFNTSLPVFQQDVVPSFFQYSVLLFVLIPVWIIVFSVTGLYDRRNLFTGTREYALIFNAITVGVFALIAFGYFSGEIVFARGWLVVTWFLAFFFAALGRFILRRVVLKLREYGFFTSRTLIVGANEESRLLAEQLSNWKYSGLYLIGFINGKTPPGTTFYKGLCSLGTIDDLDTIIQEYGIEDVILSGSALSQEQILYLYNRYGMSDRINLRMSSGLYEIITTGLRVQEFACVPLVAVNKVRLTGVDQILKAILDYSVTIVGMIVIIPLCILISIAIKLDSPGPVIYRRRVMGVNGRQFDAFKFRTMYINGDQILDAHPDLKEELARNHKLKNDPRITRVGKWLRKTSMDEIPQFFNVLIHQMSVVGPRMISPEELDEFKQWGMNLLTVKPGITGLWQVSGRSDVSYEERVRLDMYYIRNWTVWADIQLLIRTIPAAISKRGAY